MARIPLGQVSDLWRLLEADLEAVWRLLPDFGPIKAKNECCKSIGGRILPGFQSAKFQTSEGYWRLILRLFGGCFLTLALSKLQTSVVSQKRVEFRKDSNLLGLRPLEAIGG